MRVICIHLRKGGSGKTTTAVNLAAALAKQKRSVLLIDLDHQANASQALGIADTSGFKTATDVLAGDVLAAAAITERRGFDFMPADSGLAELETGMAKAPASYAYAVAQMLDGSKPNGLNPKRSVYDYVIIDTPPSESMLAIAGLVACDLAILPVQAQFLAFNGLQISLELIKRIQAAYGVDFAVRLLPTMIARTNMTKSCLKQLKANHGELLAGVSIPASVKVSEAQLFGQPIADYKPRHAVAKAYADLAKKIIKGVI